MGGRVSGCGGMSTWMILAQAGGAALAGQPPQTDTTPWGVIGAAAFTMLLGLAMFICRWHQESTTGIGD